MCNATAQNLATAFISMSPGFIFRTASYWQQLLRLETEALPKPYLIFTLKMPPLRRSKRHNSIHELPSSHSPSRFSFKKVRDGSEKQHHSQRTKSSSSKHKVPSQHGSLSTSTTPKSLSSLSSPSSLFNELEGVSPAVELVTELNAMCGQYPLRSVGYLQSRDQVLLICALKSLMTTADGEPLTDDTVSMILMYRCGAEEQSLNCGHVYQYLQEKKQDQSNQTVQAVWRQLEQGHLDWARRAQLCYWQWMEYMKGIWSR